jgi:ribosomal protein L7/L12
MRKRFSLPLLAAATIALPACSNKQVASSDTYSGFLNDYSTLTEHHSPSGQPVLSWVNPALELDRYTQVYVEPSQYYPKSLPSERLPQTTLGDTTWYYDEVLKHELGKVLTVVTTPGPNTLIVRPAITQVTASTQGLRFYEWLPITLVAAGVSTATGIRDQDSEIATEVAFLDGGTKTVVAKVVRKGTGIPLENDKQVITTANVKGVLDGWASDLRKSYLAMRK